MVCKTSAVDRASANMHAAGMYVPYIADGMLNQSDTTYFDVIGAMVYDPSIGWDSITEQATAVAFTEANSNEYVFAAAGEQQIY